MSIPRGSSTRISSFTRCPTSRRRGAATGGAAEDRGERRGEPVRADERARHDDDVPVAGRAEGERLDRRPPGTPAQAGSRPIQPSSRAARVD